MTARSHSRPTHKAKKRTQPPADSMSAWVSHLGKSLLLSLGVALFLLFTAALTAYFSPDPDTVIPPMALISSCITALAGGFCMIKLHGEGALICGLLSGSLLTVLMLILSLFLRPYASGLSTPVSLILHIVLMVFSVIGAYLGRPKPKRKRR